MIPWTVQAFSKLASPFVFTFFTKGHLDTAPKWWKMRPSVSVKFFNTLGERLLVIVDEMKESKLILPVRVSVF